MLSIEAQTRSDIAEVLLLLLIRIFSLYGDTFVTKKILDFPGNFRKFDGLPAEMKKKPLLEI